jgi:hypothetical protein
LIGYTEVVYANILFFDRYRAICVRIFDRYRAIYVRYPRTHISGRFAGQLQDCSKHIKERYLAFEYSSTSTSASTAVVSIEEKRTQRLNTSTSTVAIASSKTRIATKHPLNGSNTLQTKGCSQGFQCDWGNVATRL